MSEATLAWLAELQAQFSAVLRTPLDAETGTLRANPGSYPRDAVARALAGKQGPVTQRLAVYNRQYWFRLFTVMQGEFPLTARLLGAWTLNQHAQRFLLSHAPWHFDLQRVGHGFGEFLAEQLSEPLVLRGPRHAPLPRAAVLEAVGIDSAFQRVFLAPPQPRWQPTDDEAARLPALRLEASEAFAILEEHWPLLALRDGLVESPDEDAVALPARLHAPRTWALLRVRTGLRRFPLAARHAELLQLLGAYPLGEALARLEASCPEGQRSELAPQVQRWLAEGMRLGIWVSANLAT